MVKNSDQISLCPKLNAFNFGITKGARNATCIDDQLYYQNVGHLDKRDLEYICRIN